MGAEFRVPDFEAPFDIAARIEATPPNCLTKGMFIQGMVDTAQFAGHDVSKFKSYIPFKDYPVREYMQVSAEVARMVYGNSSTRMGLRLLGRQVYPKFLSSRLGRAIFGIALGQFAKVVDLAPRAYAQVQGSTLTITNQREGYFIGELRGVWAFPNILHIGVWEGAMESCGVQGTIRVREISASACDFEATYRG